MIKGVKIKKLKVNIDNRGRLMEILRCDDAIFLKFGQVYITTVKPGIIKAWHLHKRQTDNFVCIVGKVRLALYDNRRNSPTFKEVNEFILDSQKPKLVQIPNLVYHGIKGISKIESSIINIPTRPFNRKKPDEFRLDAFDNDIPYNWRK